MHCTVDTIRLPENHRTQSQQGRQMDCVQARRDCSTYLTTLIVIRPAEPRLFRKYCSTACCKAVNLHSRSPERVLYADVQELQTSRVSGKFGKFAPFSRRFHPIFLQSFSMQQTSFILEFCSAGKLLYFCLAF